VRLIDFREPRAEAVDQLFCVLGGAGTVTGSERRNQAVLFDAGEDHESSTTEGMVVLVLEVSSTIQLAAR
jgi:hypothetical protein